MTDKKKFAIYWDFGHGSYDTEIIEAENEEEAGKIAYENWRQTMEDNADYGVVEAPEGATNFECSRMGKAFYDDDGNEI